MENDKFKNLTINNHNYPPEDRLFWRGFEYAIGVIIAISLWLISISIVITSFKYFFGG